jgi:hypothetical protein
MMRLATLVRHWPRTPRRAAQTAAALALIGTMAAPAPPVLVAATPVPAPAAKQPPAPAVDPDAYVIKRILKIDEPMIHGFWHWDEAGVPDGPVVITVDTVAQTLSIFRGGYEIGTAVILYGADEKPTPNGVFPITQKKKHHISNIYHVPMPYMQRLTNDGVAIHASNVREGWATNGCIGVPEAFAAKLFEATELGTPVIVTSGERLQLGGAVTAIKATT